MKKPKKPEIDELIIDVVEYAFVEWLVRRKIFVAFRSNYNNASLDIKTFREGRAPSSTKPFRDCLRSHIRYLFFHPQLGPGNLISSAFMFSSTPEGYNFWRNRSESWKHFYADFQKKH